MQENPFLRKCEEETVSFGFTEKLLEGESGELFIASCLSRFGRVQIVTDKNMQKVGVDAFLTSQRLGYVTLQFKRCSKAGKSGNAFIETHICDEQKRVKSMGWALKTVANSTVYWVVGTGELYLIDTMRMKMQLSSWEKRFRVGYGCSKENGRTWYGRGLLVPLDVLRAEVCTKVLQVEEGEKKIEV